MGGLFSKPKMPAMPPPAPIPELPTPKPVRMPMEKDGASLEAAKRARADFLSRAGRRSTILSESLKETTGSSGQKLGA